MATIERRYQMIRLGKGDYLLPANDGETLWRLTHTVDEDGKRYWEVGKKIRDPEADEDLTDWGCWDPVSYYHPTRADAIQAALRMPEWEAREAERRKLSLRISYMRYGPGSLRNEQRGTAAETAHKAKVDKLRQRLRELDAR